MLLCMGFLCAMAQEATVKGKVTKQDSKETLLGVSIKTEDGKQGAITDTAGNFELKLKPGSYKIKFNSIGFVPVSKNVKLADGDVKVLNISMEEDKQELDLIVVSGSRYEKKAAKEIVSIDVLNKNLIKNTNAVELSEAIAKVPGVNIMDGQASIRGGTGFSYGVGSRVLLLVDDVPLLDGALGDARWKFVPIESAEQVEVIKGASSVLYGSSALNGIINVRTGYAKADPETNIRFYTTVVDDPKRKETKWWPASEQPFSVGTFFTHKQRFGHFDLTVGGNFNMTRSYLESNDEKRFRIDFKTRYRMPKVEGLSIGLDGNIMYEQSGRFFLWKDANEGVLQITEGSFDNYLLLNLDPWLTYFDKKGNKHTLKTRYYRTYRFGNESGTVPAAISNQEYVDYQYQRKIKEKFVVTTGAMTDVSVSTSNLFPGRRSSGQAAAFGQFEYNFKKLNLLGGIREELNFVDSLVEFSTPVFRAGLNYQAGKATYLRASWGQGYRFPTVGERFLDAGLSVLHIIPNPALVAEKGWSMELGLKQGIKINRWLGYFDFSLFWMEYKDFVEYTFDTVRVDTANIPVLYFQPKNVSQARIAGFETSIIGEGKLGPVTMRTLVGYTYSYPGDLVGDPSQKNVGTFIKNMFSYLGGITYSSPDDERRKILKYRNMHLVRADVEFEYKWASLGYSINYSSQIANYDLIFNALGLSDYFKRRLDKRGDLTMDARIGAKLGSKTKVEFIVKNLTNLEYASRPGIMNSPRNYTLQVSFSL